jgi:hypothetical protein
MTTRRLTGLVVTAAIALAVVGAGASAIAAPVIARANYHGPARPAHQSTVPRRGSNYRGPARPAARAATGPVRTNDPQKGSN